MEKSNADEYKKINLKEFLVMAKWSLKMRFHMNPFLATVSMIREIIGQLDTIIYTYLYARTIDQLIKIISTTNNDVKTMYPYIGILAFYYFYKYVSRLIGSSSGGILRQLSYSYTKQLFYHKLQELGIQNMENSEINNKLFRMNNVIGNINNYSQDIIYLIASIVVTIATAITVFSISPLLVLVVGLITIPQYLIDKNYRGQLYKHGFDETENSRKAISAANGISNARDLEEITINNSFTFFHKKFSEYYKKYDSERIKIMKGWWVIGGTVDLLSNLVLLLGYTQIFLQLAARKITVGHTTFLMSMLSNFQTKLDDTFSSFNDLLEFSFRVKEAYEIFQMEPKQKDGNEILPVLTVGPDVSFQNVTFSYPESEKLIFDKLNLEIKSGEKIAIVGQNGAGKTTLVKLIARIYTLNSGAIKINNKNINYLKISTLYKNLGILFQNYNTYTQLSVKENIYAGKSDEPLDEIGIRLAAINADAISFIEEYPNKFEQILSENYKGGTRPSTGQWQKIAIARFFYRNAPFVIFDEPTAAIDAVSEYNIFNRIYEFFTDKTVIIISHRFSTVRNADRIIVLDKGQIVEQGNHAELMASDGYYKKAFLLQAVGYQN